MVELLRKNLYVTQYVRGNPFFMLAVLIHSPFVRPTTLEVKPDVGLVFRDSPADHSDDSGLEDILGNLGLHIPILFCFNPITPLPSHAF